MVFVGVVARYSIGGCNQYSSPSVMWCLCAALCRAPHHAAVSVVAAPVVRPLAPDVSHLALRAYMNPCIYFRGARWRDVGKGDKTRLNAATCDRRARRLRPRRARSHGLQRVHSKHSWSAWSFSPVTRYDFKPACKISLLSIILL